MTLLKDILSFNETFVENKEFEKFTTTKFPNKRVVILTCMDTRLVELVTEAMNFKNGDVKIVRNAGAMSIIHLVLLCVACSLLSISYRQMKC